jgi:CRP-like cAMP-binding protein
MAESYSSPERDNPLILQLEARGRISDEEREALRRCITQTREIAPRQDIVREGSTPQDSNILLEGFVYRYRLLSDGRRQITAFHVPGDFIDLHSFLLPRMDHALAAAGPCLIGIVPHACLTRMTETLPHLMRLLWRSTAIDAAIHREWIVAMGRRSALGSVAHLFCELFVRLRAVGLTQARSFHFPVTQAELGDLTGLSTVHVNRVAQELRGSGIITWQGRTLTIVDWDRLKAVAEFNPTYLSLGHDPR